MPDRGDRSAEEPAAPARSGVSPEEVRSFRSQLTKGADVVDPTTWAGSIPQAQGIAPRVRRSPSAMALRCGYATRHNSASTK
jgi:sulfoxide reductase catalytic subunit YedY